MVTAQPEAFTGEVARQRERGGASARERLVARAEIPRVVEKVAAAMSARGYLPEEMFAVRLALEEALVNAIRHGNHDDPNKAAHLTYLVRPDMVLLEVEDEGPGFNPKSVPNPLLSDNRERGSGRGVFLMRAYMTWVRYNGKGSSVTMCRYRERDGSATGSVGQAAGLPRACGQAGGLPHILESLR